MKMFKICSVNVQKTILKLQTMLWKSPKNYFKKCSFLFWYSKKCLPKVVQDLVLKNSRKILIPKTFKKKKMFPKSLCQKFVLTKLSKSLFWKTQKNIFIPKTFKKKKKFPKCLCKKFALTKFWKYLHNWPENKKKDHHSGRKYYNHKLQQKRFTWVTRLSRDQSWWKSLFCNVYLRFIWRKFKLFF